MEIERGVPVPPFRGKYNISSTLKKMQPGDSFLLKVDLLKGDRTKQLRRLHGAVMSAIRTYRKKYPNRYVRTQRVGLDGLRVWLLEREEDESQSS